MKNLKKTKRSNRLKNSVQRFIALLAIGVGLLFFGVASANTIDEGLLTQAFEFRLSDSKRSKELIEKIKFAKLTLAQQQRYRYIDSYLKVVSGQLEAGYQDYAELLKEGLSNELRARVLNSIISISAYLSKWDESLLYAGQLMAISTEHEELAPISYKGLLFYYLEIEEYDLAFEYANKIVEHFEDLESQCIGAANIVHMQLHGKIEATSGARFSEAVQTCRLAKNNYYVIILMTTLFEIAVKDQDWGLSAGIVGELEELIQSNWNRYQAGYYFAIKSEYLNGIQDYAQAIASADQVLAIDSDLSYLEPITRAYHQLAIAHHELGNDSNAYLYQTNYIDTRDRKFNLDAKKAAAIQRARFRLEEAQGQLELLSAENEVLKTKAELGQIRVRNMFLVVLLISAVGTLAILWAQKSRQYQNKLKKIAQTDVLTELPNRKHFVTLVEEQLEKHKFNDQVDCLLLANIDNFSGISDNYGHQTAEWALQAVAEVLRNHLPDKAVAGRIGNEEFAIFVASKSSRECIELADVLERAVSSLDTIESKARFSLSISLGLADTRHAGNSYNTLSSAADLALHRARFNGYPESYKLS